MINVEKHGIILSATDHEFENNAVLNPAVFQEGNTVHIFYRAVQEGNLSTIGYAKAEGPLRVVERHEQPLIGRDFEYEKHGVEDPRIVKIDDTYYLTYTAYDGSNALGALATSTDLVHFEKQGILTPQLNYRDYEALLRCGDKGQLNTKYHRYYDMFEKLGIADHSSILIYDKDVVFFPKKINGKFAMLHRLWPSIQVAYFEHWHDLTTTYWEHYIRNLSDYIVLDPKVGFEGHYIGGGCPPIETDDGWLIVYHSVEELAKGRIYHASAALVQIDKPELEISRLPYPLFSPTKDWEKHGEVNNVVFPTGTALFGDILYLYYGAADRHIAVASVNINELLLELRRQR